MFKRFGKPYKLAATDFVTLVPCPLGHLGCVVSDRITVRGEPVGYMYRMPTNRPDDSGWRILAGTETEEETGNAALCEVWTVNEAANFDRRIVQLLASPVGSAFIADRLTGMLIVDPQGAPLDEDEDDAHPPTAPAAPPPAKVWPPPGFPIVEGEHAMTREWKIVLPLSFTRRVEDGDLVLWRPGVTIRVGVWNNDFHESRLQRLETIRAEVPSDRRDERESDADGLTRWSYRLTEVISGATVEALWAWIFTDDDLVQMAVFFDHESDEPLARALIDSVARRVQ